MAAGDPGEDAARPAPVILFGATGWEANLSPNGKQLLSTREDMELNGAVPNVIVRNLPGDSVLGRDRQVERAVDVLARDVKAAAKKAQAEARPASGR